MEVFVLDLDELRPRAEEALALLSPGRREKALRLRREVPRLQSIGAGLLLRAFFGAGDPVAAPGGKPFFPDRRPFSLTHSGNIAAIALASEPAGLDAEAASPPPPALPPRVLTETEQAWLAGRGGDGFAFLWTRKEAALKCLGTGADRALSSFSVLEDSVALDGAVLRLHTVPWKGYMLSAAARGDASFTPGPIAVDELIRMGQVWNS